MKTFRIGTRGSKLAMAQTQHVADLLSDRNPSVSNKIITIKTAGDVDQKTPLENIGGVGLFTKQLEQALLDNKIDIAVHSAKDLPAIMTKGLKIGAIPEREDFRDAWLSKDGLNMDKIEKAAVVGTSSPRRRAQLMQFRKGFEVRDIRGNVDTRIKKLHDGEYDAIVMATAGLKRLGLEDEITEIIEPRKILPAPGQGFLLIQVRADDEDSLEYVGKINNFQMRHCLEAERMLLAGLHAGCSAAVGGLAQFKANEIFLQAVVLDKRGERRLFKSHRIGQGQSLSDLVDPVLEFMVKNGAQKMIEDAEK